MEGLVNPKATAARSDLKGFLQPSPMCAEAAALLPSGQDLGADTAMHTSPIVVPLAGNCRKQHRTDQLAETLLTIIVPPVIEIQLAIDGRQPWTKWLQRLCMPEFLPRCNQNSVRDRCGALSRGPYDWSDPGHYSVRSVRAASYLETRKEMPLADTKKNK